MIKQIANKREAVRLFSLGYFGNMVRQWDTFEQLMKDLFQGNIVIRQKERQRGGRGVTIYDVPKDEVSLRIDSLRRRGVKPSTLYFNEAIIPSTVIFQGEIIRNVGGLYLLYSTLPAHMHDALLKEPKHAFGLKVKLLMERYLCYEGLICIFDFLERFVDHVIEFTCCSQALGNLSWRTIIWECRKF